VHGVTRVLIIDSFSSDNSGDAAILATMMDSLKEVIENVEFKVHSFYPDVTREIHQIEASYPLFMAPLRSKLHTVSGSEAKHLDKLPALLAQAFPNVFKFAINLTKFSLVCLLAALNQLGLCLSNWAVLRKWEPFIDYCSADVIWATGGTYYNDNYRKDLSERLLNLLSGYVLGKLVCISSHSFGPFRRQSSRLTARVVFNRLDLICCRAMQDADVLRDLGIDADRIQVTADTAWLLCPHSRSQAQQLLDKEGIRLEDIDFPVSLSAVRSWLYHDVDPHAAHQVYVETLTEVINRLVRIYGARILFASTCSGRTTRDDRLVAAEIKERIEYPERFHVLKNAYRAEELKAIYGLMKIHIGTRMHSNILALSMGVPVLNIAYEAKSFGLMDSIGLNEYVVDIQNVSVEPLWDKVTMLIDNRDELREYLLGQLPEMERRARLNAVYLAERLRLEQRLL